MHIVGVIAFTENNLSEIAELETSLRFLGYPVHLEQMGYTIETAHIGDYYYEKDAILLWLCRCYGDQDRCRQSTERFVLEQVDIIVTTSEQALKIVLSDTTGTGIPVVFTHASQAATASIPDGSAGRTVTGVRDDWLEVVEEKMACAMEIVPTPTTLHMFYSADSPITRQETDRLRRIAKTMSLKLAFYPVLSNADVRRRLSEITIRDSHAIFLLSDLTASSISSLLGLTAHERYCPYIGLSMEELESCNALLVLEVSGIGSQAAAIIQRILEGENPGSSSES